MSEARSFSAEPILAGLKKFQRNTVEYVFRRFYLDSDATSRFLVADEVGLGKTLVARGVIAKAIEHLRKSLGNEHRIDIVYICSNSSIARQNVNRLNVVEGSGFELASRITLLPIQLNNLNNSPDKINFVSFTPGTSFDQKSNIGMKDERVLLYKMLQKPWNLRGVSALNMLQGNVQDAIYFREQAWQEVDINEQISERFSRMVCSQENTQLREQFMKSCSQFQRSRKTRRPYEQRVERNRIIGDLRGILAEACIESLEPDIVILDEFQRFKHLLVENDECSKLARRLFDYVDQKTNTCAKVLLLSATPYKMYTLRDETNIEDHYSDFIQTYKFLERDKTRQSEFEESLNRFRDILLSPKQAISENAKEIKSKVECLLRKVMVRTERLAATNDRNGMLREIETSDKTNFNTSQIRSYVAIDKIAAQLEMPNIVEYWKSSPYLLNFMDDYKLKQSFNEASRLQPFRSKTVNELSDCLPSVLLSEEDIRLYKEVNPCNARLMRLFSEVLDIGAWKTLWIPPSLPYYKLGQPFQHVWENRFTKRLIFSTWKIVPKAISIMLSYEAERRMNMLFSNEAQNSTEARKKRRPLLRFAIAEGRETGMPVFSLIYPCATFAKYCDPLELYTSLTAFDEPLQEISEVLKRTQIQIEKLMTKLTPFENVTGSTDETWYWAAPILIDAINNSENKWLHESDVSDMWSNSDDDENEQSQDETSDAENTSFDKHVKRIQTLLREFEKGTLKLGKRPDDLNDVLSFIAIAGPATCVFRSLNRVVVNGDGISNPLLLMCAAQAGYAFASMFNSPDITAMIRGLDGREPYWRRVVEYCANGCVQAMFDEYVHILKESLGMVEKSDQKAAESITVALRETMNLRTASLSVDNIDTATLQKKDRFESFGRVHFALRFGDEKGDDGNIVTRADQVRNSFNSPFWPFVLATTSIGQEGLDFHQYCHAIVHWNLPSNPVDLEQREGRIHRYKNHAVRKNIAKKYALFMRNEFYGDIWEKLFQRATQEHGDEFDEIVPYWVFQVEDGAFIERHIPMLPLSREIDKCILLKKSLAAYRMVFGQTRQEDLVEYLMSNFKEEEMDAISKQLRIDLSPIANLNIKGQ